MNVLLQGNIAVEAKSILAQYSEPDWMLETWSPATDTLEDFAARLKLADVVVGGNIPLQTWPSVPQLKLFQIPWAGYDFTSPERMPATVPVANCFEHEGAIAEYVLLAMLETQIGLCRMDSKFRDAGWDGRVIGMAGNYHGEIAGKTLGIVGYGHIGSAVAQRAAAFGMDVIGLRTRADTSPPAPLSWQGGREDLPALLGRSDFVLVACAMSEATIDLIDAPEFAAMKNDAVLINVARGRIVNQQALYNALSTGVIGGAVIDVWYNYNQPGEPEVAPSDFDFAGLDNVLLSAHESGWTEAQVHRRWQFVARNIQRIASGETPENIVFTGTAATER